MEPFEWIVAGALMYAVFPGVRKAVSKTWQSLVNTTNQTQNMLPPDQQQP